MKKDHRWMKSAVAAAQDMQVVLPFQRGSKTRPAALKTAPAPVKQRAIAAR